MAEDEARRPCVTREVSDLPRRPVPPPSPSPPFAPAKAEPLAPASSVFRLLLLRRRLGGGW